MGETAPDPAPSGSEGKTSEAGVAQDLSELEELKTLNRVLIREVSSLEGQHGIVIRAMIRLQGLLCQFARDEIRVAFLRGDFGVIFNSGAFLISLDAIRDILLPRPTSHGGMLSGDDPSIGFVGKLLSKDSSEPKDRLGRWLKVRQSFGAWRSDCNQLMCSEFWIGQSAGPGNVDGFHSKPAHSPVRPSDGNHGSGYVAEALHDRNVQKGSSGPPERASTGYSVRKPKLENNCRVRTSGIDDHSSDTSDDEGVIPAMGGAARNSTVNSLADALGQFGFQREVLSPGKFDSATGYSLGRFLKSYERYFDAKFFGSDQGKAQHLAQFLSGTVKRAYDAMRGGNIKYPKLKEKLLSWYSSEKIDSRQAKLGKFMACQMMRDDSFTIYCIRLEQLAELAFPDNPQDRDRQLCRRFRQTVPPHFIAQLDFAQTTLSIVGDCRMDWVQIKKIAETLDKRVHEQKVDEQYFSEDADLAICLNRYGGMEDPHDYQTRGGRYSPPMPSRVFSKKRDVSFADGRQRSGGSPGRDNTIPSRRAGKSCYWCGRAGHIEKDCWRKTGKCLACGDPDHTVSGCPRRRDTPNSDAVAMRCSRCGGPHLGKDCAAEGAEAQLNC